MTCSFLSRIALTLAAFLTVSAAAVRADEAPSYSTHVQPVLKKYCVGCHNAKDHEGKLVLDTYANLMKGGEHGAAVTAGHAELSRMTRMLTGAAKPQMPPPEHDQPKQAEIAAISAWIDSGAKGPEGAEPDRHLLVTPQVPVTKPAARSIHALAISPSGKLLAVARYGTVEIYSLPERTLLKELTGHRGSVNGVSFSADGSLLVAAAGEVGLFGEARLWNTSDWSLARMVEGHADAFYNATLSPSGELLAAGGYDGHISLWDTKSGALKHTLAGHNGAVFDLAFHPSGKMLASASGDRTVKLWNVADGQRLDTFVEPLKEQYAVAFNPAGTQLAAGGADNRIRVWRLSESGKEGTNKLAVSRFAHEGAILRLFWPADGKAIISAAEDRALKIWHADTIFFQSKLSAPAEVPVAVAVALDGQSLVMGKSAGGFELVPLAAASQTQITSAAPLAESLPEIDYGEQPALDKLPKVAEVEPNDELSQATPLAIPGVATGRIFAEKGAAADRADFFRFTAKAGDQWILETNAARAKSPIDTRLEVLTVSGAPIPAVRLQAVRNSELEFRGMDSNGGGLRAANWEEMLLNEYLYLNGEVIKLFQQRQGPDSNAAVYSRGGNRHSYFGSSPRAHPLGEQIFVVVPFAPSAKLGDSGLPVFTLNYDNDDDGRRVLGSDSYIAFVAPADGQYVARVSDARGFAGEKFTYELVVRRPRPDFSVTLEGAKNPVNAGSGKSFKVRAERVDGFSGDIRVDISELPPGWLASTPIVIQAGHLLADGVIAAAPGATQLTDQEWRKVKFYATANISGKPVKKPVPGIASLKLLEPPKIVAHLELDGAPVPPPLPLRTWTPLEVVKAESKEGATLTKQPDQSVLASGKNPDHDTYVVTLRTPLTGIRALRLEALGDKSLPSAAPGRVTPNGNFVLTEVKATAAPQGDISKLQPLTFASAVVDYAQGGFSAAGLIDGNPKTGWAVATNDDKKGFPVMKLGDDATHHARFELKEPVGFEKGTEFTITLEHTSSSKQHNLGRFRLLATRDVLPDLPTTFPEPPLVTIAPGGTATCRLRVERHGFTERIQFDMNNLPHGVIVDNIGLNGVLIPEKQSERQLYFAAEPWVGETERLIHVMAKVEGNQSSLPLRFRVSKAK